MDMTWLNNNYQRSLAKYVHRCSVYRLRELQPSHRYIALVCFLWQVSRDTVDYMVDMYFKLMNKLYTQAEHQIDTEMQKKRKNIKLSLTMLKTIGAVLLDETVTDLDLRKTVFTQVKKEELQTQILASKTWLTGKFSHVFNLVVNRFSYLRRFAPALLEHLHFETESEQAHSLLKAINMLREMNHANKRKLSDETSIDFMPNEVAGYLKERLNLSYDNFFAKLPENNYANIENDRWVLSVDSAETFTAEESHALEKLRSWLAAKQSKREANDICAILEFFLMLEKASNVSQGEGKKEMAEAGTTHLEAFSPLGLIV